MVEKNVNRQGAMLYLLSYAEKEKIHLYYASNWLSNIRWQAITAAFQLILFKSGMPHASTYLNNNRRYMQRWSYNKNIDILNMTRFLSTLACDILNFSKMIICLKVSITLGKIKQQTWDIYTELLCEHVNNIRQDKRSL